MIPLNITALKYNIVFCTIAVFVLIGAAPPAEENEGESGRGQPVPISAVIDYFQFEYRYSSTTGTMELYNDQKSVTIIPGSNEVFIDQRTAYLGQRVFIRDDGIMVPPECVDLITWELLKKKVPWRYNGETFTVGREEAGEDSGGGEGAARRRQPRRASRSAKVQRPTEFEVKTIILDPGHGGKDPGGIGYNDIREKDIVLSITKDLARELQSRFRDKEIILTRQDDTFISLEERGNIANRVDPANNPVFISVHANVSFSSKTYGYESFFLSLDPFGENARDVASMENSVLDYEIENYNDYLKEILNRIVDIEFRRESRQLAKSIQNRIEGTVSDGSRNRGVKSAFFYVLKSAKMPAVLVETGFVTNKNEALSLLQPEYQHKIVEGIADGIEDFVTAFSETEGFTTD